MNGKIETADFVYTVLAGKIKNNTYHTERYLGCGFFLSTKGRFLTCAHVVRALKEGEVLAIQKLGDATLGIIRRYFIHEKFDVAVLDTSIEVKEVFEPYSNPLSAGDDVHALGYYNPRKDGENVLVSFQLFKGYITSLWLNDGSVEAGRTVIQLSFPVLNGFSGGPLLIGHKVCGMLFINKESAITVAHSKYEEKVETVGSTVVTIEKIQRIFEIGIAHQISDIQKWVATLPNELEWIPDQASKNV